MMNLKFAPIDQELFDRAMAEAHAEDRVELIEQGTLHALFKIADNIYVGIACAGTEPGHGHLYVAAKVIVENPAPVSKDLN